MKQPFKLFIALSLGLVMIMGSCSKETNSSKTKEINEKISFKSIEPDEKIKGTGKKEDYKKVIIKDLEKKEDCNWEVVSGIIEFYYLEEMVFSVDFGSGECDGLATVYWLDEDGILQTKSVDVWSIFKK